MAAYRNESFVLLAGGVGGARLARGLAATASRLTIIVNVGDDETTYGLAVSPDIDTVLYTLAGIEGPHGWGIAGDSFTVMGHLGGLGEDVSFQIGDRDLATNLFRSDRLAEGTPLSAVTAELRHALGVAAEVLPATDDPVPTRIEVAEGWISFQDYFVRRSHRDDVADVSFAGADEAKPAPGVVAAISGAAAVVIAPSNPPLSIWPILAVPGIREAVARKDRVIAISPLIGGKALKGPADRVMASLGLPPGNAGVAAAYDGLVTDLIIDDADAGDGSPEGVTVHATSTRIAGSVESERLARFILELV